MRRAQTLARRLCAGSLLPRAPQRLIKSICSRYFDVGLDSRALPICLGDWVDEATERHPNEEMLINAVWRHNMSTTARGFTD